jgi:lysyl-tRNA synthetase class 2
MLRSRRVLPPNYQAKYLLASAQRTSIPAFVAGGLQDPAKPVTLAGRITSLVRPVSKHLFFFHIESEGGRVQVLADEAHFEDRAGFHAAHALLARGDIVQVHGVAVRSRSGELSLMPRRTELLTPSLRIAPLGRGDGKYRLGDVGDRYRRREVDLLAGGAEAREVFRRRARAVQALRGLLLQRDFVEVETPVLWPSAGGAAAKPFRTTSRDLHLRIAPELALKRLVVGGFDRVFEIGRVFRDEGVSVRHNPEFTSCELYQAYAGLEDMAATTRDVLQAMSDAAGAGLDFASREFARLSVADELERLGLRMDDPESMTVPRLVELSARLHVPRAAHLSVPRLLDKLVGFAVEAKCDPEVPTLLTEHPLALSPLAREDPARPGVAQRFELFFKDMELCNAYCELSDPAEQRRRFAQQAAIRAEGDDEAQALDEDFCEALEYGLPPTVGWGMGLDRVVMLLCRQASIRDVILFPSSIPRQR